METNVIILIHVCIVIYCFLQVQVVQMLFGDNAKANRVQVMTMFFASVLPLLNILIAAMLTILVHGKIVKLYRTRKKNESNHLQS